MEGQSDDKPKTGNDYKTLMESMRDEGEAQDGKRRARMDKAATRKPKALGKKPLPPKPQGKGTESKDMPPSGVK